MKLYICEKPSQAADIARVLGNARKAGTHWETNGGRVTWCFGHLVEMASPEDYDPKYKAWNFSDLPIVPERFRFGPKKDAASQLRAIGDLLRGSDGVVIATDADREGEMIGREVLVHHRYTGPVDRLWLSALDEESVRKALGRLKPGAETVSLYYAALARSEADWLVGMNMTRAMTTKSGGAGVFSIGRVQTPTVAIVVRRDREIANFKPRDYFEVVADIRAANGEEVKLTYAPRENDRLWDRSKADAIAAAVRAQRVTLSSETQDKTTAPPKLFSLSALQKRANTLWGWSADKTLAIAQSLYETHKATTYPRSDCEFLPEEQLGDVPHITSNLLELDAFKHLKGEALAPRKVVFNTSKITAHHAIIPTKVAPPLANMSADERQAYLLIARHYLASLLQDYRYQSTKISAVAAKVEFATTGRTPVAPGWKRAFPQAELEDDDGAVTLPKIPNGTAGEVEGATVETKQTKPPAAYTEGTLIEDMKMVAKFVTDPDKKARLKETSGIGTEATRANIIKTIKDREYVVVQGKKIVSTPKGRALISALEGELPALADPGETAVWEEGLEAVAQGKQSTETFVAAITGRIRENLSVLAKKPDAPRAAVAEGKPTGVKIGTTDLLDHGEFYSAAGAVPGRIYKSVAGHTLTPAEVSELLAGKTLELTDCRTQGGLPAGPKKIHYNAKKKPYPGVDFVSAPAIATNAASPRKEGAAIQDHGDYFTVPGYIAGGRDVRFYKKLAGRAISAEELAAILAAKEGIRMSGFRKADGTPFKSDPIVKYNARKTPYAGLDFEFDSPRESASTGKPSGTTATKPSYAIGGGTRTPYRGMGAT